MPQATIRKYYRIDRRKIYYLKFILEGYDGLAVMRTVDPQEGLVVLHVGPGCEGEVDMIIRDLQNHIAIKTVEIPGEETFAKRFNFIQGQERRRF